jgi:hypothetical protein
MKKAKRGETTKALRNHTIPLYRSHHGALKLVLEHPMENRKENSKGK